MGRGTDPVLEFIDDQSQLPGFVTAPTLQDLP